MQSELNSSQADQSRLEFDAPTGHKDLQETVRQSDFEDLKGFDFLNSNACLWVFKKSTTSKKYLAHFVPTDENLTDHLKNLAKNELNKIIEFALYTHLSQTNENSCLAIEQSSTDFSFLKTQVDRVAPECRAKGIKDLTGAEGYVVKFELDSKTIYAVKRSSSSWKTSYSKKYINIIFHNGELSAVEDKTFSIEKNFDFFAIESNIFIRNKKSFESALEHKTAYTEVVSKLNATPEFLSLFTDAKPLIDFVGNNTIQLRRMAVVEQKGLYNNPIFLSKLRSVSNKKGWGINFCASTNKIIPCETTARTILQTLLDHRLMSEVTSMEYDVPDATPVSH